jgi:hypothetical protein
VGIEIAEGKSRFFATSLVPKVRVPYSSSWKMIMRFFYWLSAGLIGLTSILGCGREINGGNSSSYLENASSEAVLVKHTEGSDKTPSNINASAGNAEASAKGPILSRHIVYSAEVDLEVTDLDQMTTQLNAQLQQLQGFVSNFSEHRRDGDRRTATWTIRIDASKFSEFLKWLDGEANVVRKQITSKDVTEDYIDLKARLSNKQATEKRLAKLLEENAGKLEEVLAFEREIDRTREEIERIEGKLRLLEDQLALSTIKLIASTRLDYLATQPVMLSTSVSETWSQSIGSLQKLGKVLLLLCVGAVPWLPILAMVVAIITWLAKKESRPIEERSV